MHEKSSIFRNVATFRRKNHVTALWSTFQKKVAKSGSFREKAQYLIDLPKLATFRWNYHVSAFSSTFRHNGEKVANFLKKNEKSSIWPNLDTFRANYHVSAFWSSFDQKVGKSDSFREKARKIIVLPKTSDFSAKFQTVAYFLEKHKRSSIWPNLPTLRTNYHFFGVLAKFSPKSYKVWLISWTSTKNHRFGQNLTLSEETSMFRGFGQLFSKKLQKLAHLVKNHEKS